MSNFFDQFDESQQRNKSNFFDKFDDATKASPEEKGTLSQVGSAFGAGIDKMQELGYRAVKGFTDVGVPQEEQTNALGRAIGQGGALSRWADEGIARNIEEQKAYTPSVASYKDIDSFSDVGNYVGEMTAQSVPMMAAALNPLGLFAMGGGMSNEAYETQPEDNKQPWRATVSGFGQAGLERLGVESSIGRILGGERKNVIKRVGQSALTEGITETGQEALAQWGGGKSIDEFENLDEAFVGGALVGGTIRTSTEAGKAVYEAGKAAYDKYRGERPELSDIEETDLTQSASSAESVIPDPSADIGPAQDQAVTGNEIEIIPGETAGDSQPNWQFGQNDMPYRGEVTPYVYDGENEQYRETPNSVPVGAALEAPIIDGEFERPRGLHNRADTIIGEDGRSMQQAQEFADSVGQASNRALPFDDVIYAEDKRNVQVKRNGQPFGGRRAAELTKEFRQAKEQGLNPQVIKVNGGYGWVSESDNVGLDTGIVEQSSDRQVGSAGIALPRDVRGGEGRRLRESADGATGTGDAENIALAARRDTNDDALGEEVEETPTNEGVAELDAESQVIPKWKERQARIDGIAKDYVGKLQGETGQERVAQIMADGHSEIDAQHIATSANMMEMAAISERTRAVDQAANEAATSPTNNLPEPTEAQKEAGNYKKGKVRLHGLDISIENPKGSTRKGKDQDGKEWSSEMKHHYGDIKGTTGADGDSIDVFIGDNPESQKVFVVDQVDPKTGNFDEVKVMMGFDDAETAKSGYLSNYDKDWKGLGEITEASVEDFKAWTKRPRKSKQPFAQDLKVKNAEASIAKKGEEASKAQLTDEPKILSITESAWVKSEIKRLALKKGSPGYDAAVSKVKDSYDANYDEAIATVSFERYKELNPDTPESILRKSYDSIKNTAVENGDASFRAADNGNVSTASNSGSVSRADADKVIGDIIRSWSGGVKARRNEFFVASTFNELPNDIKEAAKKQGAEGKVYGVFHNGKTYVVLDKHRSTKEVETTIFHETYGHHGMRKLFGADINRKMNNLYTAIGGMSGLRKAAKNHGVNLDIYIRGADKAKIPQELRNRVLMEELLAHIQQDNRPSVKRLAKELIGAIRQKLRDIGFAELSNVSDSDLFHILKQSRDAVKKGDTQTGDARFMVDDKSASVDSEMSSEPISFRITEDASNTPQSFSAPVEKKWSKDWFKRKLQDKFAPIKDMQASIEKATGRELPEDQNAYRAEELFYGKTENDLNKMEKNHVKPLVDAMTRNNIDSAELDQFLIAKHARERNAHIASINPEMQDGGSGMTNAEADTILSRYEQEGKLRGLEAAASEVYKITQKRRELMRDAGLEDESLLDVWDATYEFYVPLKGYAEDSEGNSVAKTGSGFDIRGKESMRAMGRRTIAESPTAHAIQDLSATIIRSRKNEVGRTFLKMVEENPNPDIWEVFTEDNPDTERRIVNGEVKENQPIDMRSRKDDYFSVKVDGQSKYIKLKDKDGLLMKAMKNMGPEQMNTFTRSMSEVTRWLSMVNTSLNPEFTVTNFTRDIQTALFNALAEQDLTDGKVKDKAIAMKMIKGSGKAVKSLWQHSAGKLDETDPMYKWIEEFLSDGAKTGYFDSKEVDKIGTDLADLLDMANGTNKGKLLKAKHKIGDFIENVNGGIENGVRLSSYIEARKAGVTREKAASFAKNLTVNFNRKGEIGTFLNSLYMFFNAAVQGNANFARAIITPKVDEVTGKKSLNMAQKVAVGISLASFGWAALMREMAGDDEDDVPYWDKIPKGVRERNFIIPKTLWGGEPGEYVKIPLPYGYNIFYNLGDAAEAAINSDTRKSGDLAAEMALSVYASFVPLGSPVGDNGAESAALVASPTFFKPIVEIATNKNFFGGPIYRENNPYGPQLRDSQMSMRSTGGGYKWMASFMNDVIGDGRSYKVNGENPWYDVSPDSIEHLVEFSLGGLYRFGSRIYDNVAKSAQGGELESTDIPFARQLNGKVQPYADITQFYEARQQLKNIDAEMDSLRGKERLEFRKEYGDKLRLQGLMGTLDKRMKMLGKQRDRVEINESISFAEKQKKLQRIEDQMKSTAARFNKRWNEVN